MISENYIHYQPHDLNCKIELERLNINTLTRIPYKTLNECESLANNLSISRVNILGVIIDYVVENKLGKDNFFKLRLIDQSLDIEKSIQMNIFLKDSSINVMSIGDIFVANGVSFKIFKGKVVGTYNKLSKGFGVFH